MDLGYGDVRILPDHRSDLHPEAVLQVCGRVRVRVSVRVRDMV